MLQLSERLFVIAVKTVENAAARTPQRAGHQIWPVLGDSFEYSVTTAIRCILAVLVMVRICHGTGPGISSAVMRASSIVMISPSQEY